MLSASAYFFRQKSRLAISLSWIAGYTNVIVLILCNHVVAHVTGNVTQFGQGLADRAPGWVAYFGFVLAAFFAGAVASACMTEGARRRGVTSKYILPMTVEALALCAISALISWTGLGAATRLSFEHHPVLFWTISGLGAFAMGLQNATITKISGAEVRTTHLTGVLTDLGLEGVQYVLWAWDRTRGGRGGDIRRPDRPDGSFDSPAGTPACCG